MTQRKTVRLGGKQLRIATKLNPATNAKRGYCPTCSGLGTHGKAKAGKARPCRRCNGTGRAPEKTPAATKQAKTTAKTTAKKTATTPARRAPARTSAQTVAARRRTTTAARTSDSQPRTAYGASAARRASARRITKTRRSNKRTMLRLLGIGGKRLTLRRALGSWLRNTFGTRTVNAAQARRRLANVNDIYGDFAGPEGSWSWKCQLCPTWGDYARNQLLTASDDMSNHMVEAHPGHTADQKPHANFDHVDVLYALNTRSR